MGAKQARVELLAGERHKGESGPAVVACNDFLRLGVGRKLPALAQRYTESDQNKPPTRSLATLKKWSATYDWAARAETFDAEQEKEKEAERRQVMRNGLALDYERVRKLIGVAEFLESQIALTGEDGPGRPAVWVHDVKSIGGGEFAEKVDIYRFNAALFDQFRGTLDDLAKETGGRIKKQDITSDGKPVPILVVKMDMDEL